MAGLNEAAIGADFRMVPESRRLAEAGEVQAAPPDPVPELGGRFQAASSQGTLGTAGAHPRRRAAHPTLHPGLSPEPCLPARSFYFDETVLTGL